MVWYAAYLFSPIFYLVNHNAKPAIFSFILIHALSNGAYINLHICDVGCLKSASVVCIF